MQGRMAEFEVMNKLGSGSFGVVYKVRYKKDNKIYVLKVIDTSKMHRQQRAEAAKESQLMSKLDNPYVIKMYESFTTQMKINIVMELCENGDLGLYLKR